ncbi:ribbon-helix-helix domain-containing protein [Xanthobacteraceae bacterium Astr-EGSB]|uniref:ribbon-helix-helix domain-containing protein n=1 Tax=Astrobacterium formosum TaxID=3069710 RepID=UPI0027B19D67|nr:ribbon-helix-helix domain-containing protein [Xanthobacteraceae bacterium Astr-EGSB]
MNAEEPRQSTVVKRSVVVAGQKTSISIEDAFWSELKSLARRQNRTVSDLVHAINAGRREGANLSSAVRVYILDQLRSRTGGGEP